MSHSQPSLHERRRHMTHVDEDHSHNSDPNPDLDDFYPDIPKKRRKLGEMKLALLVSVPFVVFGLMLCGLLLHNQHRKVIFHAIRNPWAHGRAALRMAATRKRHNSDGFHHHFYSGAPRFVTVVLPSVVNPKGRSERLHAIHDTWGPHARAIYVLHNAAEFAKGNYLTWEEKSRPWDPYSYPQNLLLPSKIGVENGVERLIYTIRMVHEKVDPDFAFFVNDHTYVIASHLCRYLETKHATAEMYEGHALKNGEAIFNSGAAGYVLSRATMRKLIQRWDDKSPECFLGEKSNKKWLQGNPGLLTVTCLATFGVTAIDTRDRRKAHRFHAFPITRMVSGQVDQWYINKHKFEELPDTLRRGFDESYSELKSGTDCCSAETVSFHYVEHHECKAMFAIRHHLLNSIHISDIDLKELVKREWPRTKGEIGAYSRALPDDSDTSAWTSLMNTFRKISTRSSQADC